MPERIDVLTDKQRAQMAPWAQKWIDVGLRTGEMNIERFSGAVRDCYRLSKLQRPESIVRVSSPMALALAAPIADFLSRLQNKDGAVGDAVYGAVGSAVGSAVRGAVHGAVGDAVGDAVHSAVGGAVESAVDGAVGDAVGGAVGSAVDGAVGDAVRDAVGDAVVIAVRDAVGGAVGSAVGDAVGRKAPWNHIHANWHKFIGGQFWVGGWWGSPAYVAFLRDVCELQLDEDITARADAYRITAEEACWWWPHREFVMVCERPTHIDRDSDGRLHSASKQAIAWPDGWGLYVWHGVRVTKQIIETPETITVAQIDAEANAEVRRIMIERYGQARYIQDSGATLVAEDMFGKLWRKELAGDEPIMVVQVINSTPEPDGTSKHYWLRVDPNAYGGLKSARAAVASTWRKPDGSMMFAKPDDYAPDLET